MNTAKTLPPDAFRRADETPDAHFYRSPRFVAHIDDGAIAAVTLVYREQFPAGGTILDLMSSWISHLPNEIAYSEVVGLGMNREELAANPRLSEYVVQDLNENPALPFADSRFDGAAICVSVDYLTDPVAVLTDAARTLKPGSPMVITFSNRCFPTKAIAAWHALDEAGRVQLVAHFLEQTGAFENIEAFDRSPVSREGRRIGDPLYAVIGRATGV
ncbi:MAG: methyltransferase domain-containing protein [Armatimonadetes bacterium]|nr:methyltransferase domain-containing protein [Armatimonadota bacterium]